MIDMTTGSIPRHMLKFTVPFLLSNVFQQLYNAVDAIIVGRYVGKEALAAVGSAGAIMNILLFLIVGMSLGASVLIAEYYGEHNDVLVKKEMGTSLTAGLLFTVGLTATSLFCVNWALKLIQTPTAVLPQAEQYLRIIISGLVFTFLYNILSSALRALGDAKAPMFFLVLSSVLHVILDIFFIRYLFMGVAGAALATVISQGAAAGMCIVYIIYCSPLLRLKRNELKIEYGLLKKTLQYSGIYAAQQSVLYGGVLLVQGIVNTLGIDYMAAYNAVTKIDNLSLIPGDSLAASLSTFIAQNKGAKQYDRIPFRFEKLCHYQLMLLRNTCTASASNFGLAYGVVSGFLRSECHINRSFLFRHYVSSLSVIGHLQYLSGILPRPWEYAGDIECHIPSNTRTCGTFVLYD